jgi:hypothetical protein
MPPREIIAKFTFGVTANRFYLSFSVKSVKSEFVALPMNNLRLIHLALLSCATLTTGCGVLPLSNFFSESAPGLDQNPISAPAAQAPRQNATCITPNYFAKVVWQAEQPSLTFGAKPDKLTLNNAPSGVAQNADGSLTYSSPGESTTYTRVYADNSCFIQVVGAGNQVVLEENGTLGTY